MIVVAKLNIDRTFPVVARSPCMHLQIDGLGGLEGLVGARGEPCPKILGWGGSI